MGTICSTSSLQIEASNEAKSAIFSHFQFLGAALIFLTTHRYQPRCALLMKSLLRI